MTAAAHLWALGFDDTSRADQILEELVGLSKKHCLILLDTAVVVRYLDGCVTLNGERFVAPLPVGGRTLAGFLAGLALGAPPLTGVAVGAFLGGTCPLAPAAVGIDDNFILEVERLMKPGTSALFVLDQEGDMEALLQGIRGLGGTVLKTTVDLKRAELIQSALSGPVRDVR
jgi:uncharacterized membrane protein